MSPLSNVRHADYKLNNADHTVRAGLLGCRVVHRATLKVVLNAKRKRLKQ